MSLEALFWGVIPAILAIASLVISLICAVRAKRTTNWLAFTLVTLSVSYALLLLKGMFVDGASPIYIPHALVTLAVSISAWQFKMQRDRNQNA